jgi:hypothetical protein
MSQGQLTKENFKMSKYEEVTNRLYAQFDRQLDRVRSNSNPSKRELRKLDTIATMCLQRITPDRGDSIREALARTH